MDSPESVVDTSDVEEREVSIFSKDVHHVAFPSPVHSMHVEIASPQYDSTSVARRGRPSDDEIEDASPRKRIKVAHDTNSPTPGSPRSAVVEAALFNNGPLDVPITGHIPGLDLTHTPQRVSASQDQQQGSTSSSLMDLSPLSVCHSLFSAPSQSLSKQDSPLTTHSVRSRSVESQTLPRLAAISTDALQTIPCPTHSPPVVIPEDTHPPGRYSLRRREARQLNPYAYDKLLYRQQLKFHPDAIVKFKSPRRRHEGGEPETQDGCVFFVDNPDEDGDYVEAEGVQRRRRAAGFDHGQETGGEQEESWLPEALKGLSSDEDESEIRKLARNIRKEREAAKTMARAKAKGATTEARHNRTKTTTKPHLRPFPVHREAEPASNFLEHVPTQKPSPSPFSRAHSEPAMASCPLPSQKSPSGHHVPLRASSYSPAPALGSLPLPDFNIGLQEDSYGFDDPGNSPWAVLPVDHSMAFSAPSSPTGPPTTSSVSVLASNASGMDSDSDQFTRETSSKDKKRMRALNRMMPRVMVKQLDLSKETRRPLPRARAAVESSGSEAEEVRVIPGLARVRRGKYKDVEVKGDPESSDDEPPMVFGDVGQGDVDLSMDTFSDEQSIVSVRRIRRSLKPHGGDDVISLSDSSLPGSSEDLESRSSGDEMAHQSLFDRPAKGPSRERSLIDWMLSRTRDASRPKTRSKKTTSTRKSRGSGAPKLDIVTKGARRYEDQHQTRLPFTRIHTGRSTTSSTKLNSEKLTRVHQLERDTTEDGNIKKKRKQQSRKNQGLLYSVHHDATRITSKHSKTKPSRDMTMMVIEGKDDQLRQALDPGWEAEIERWNRPKSPILWSAVAPAPSIPAAPQSRIHRRVSPQPQDELPLPHYFQRQNSALPHRYVVVDMNITPFPSGVKFSMSTYVGRGLLYELVSVISESPEIAPPIFCSAQGLEIGPTTSAAVFKELLGPLFDRFASALRDIEADDTTMREWESVARAVSQLISWLAVHAEDRDFDALEAVLREYTDSLLLLLRSLGTSVFSLSAHWFLVELSARLAIGIKYRRGTMENMYLVYSAKQLMQRLLEVDLRPAFTIFHAAEGDVDDVSLSHRVVEYWICLVYLLPKVQDSPDAASSHPLWQLLSELHPESSPTGPDASEDLWCSLFNLCAISRFSVHGLCTSTSRLPAAWDLVATALRKIVLTSNEESERKLSGSTLRMRDVYISFVVRRCFHLWNRWGWRLDDAIVMFKSLQEIFRSRNFANLLIEQSAPMDFIEHGDLELLSRGDPQDTVFDIFLKMVVQAVYQLNANAELDPKQRSTHIKKLLQMAVPVSPLPFTRSAPPSPLSLSMLVNRFSAMAISVHLDPTTSNVKFRVGQAKRCVSFKDADDESRIACVYGMMNFSMIVRHHKVVGGLEEVLGWLGEMTNVLMDEYMEEDAGSIRKQRVITLIQLLIGSVRRVIETPSLNKGWSIAEYPDPALLDGPWVTRVFNPRTDLITIQQTGVEIRMLVQSFLNARLKAVPDIKPPPPPIVHSVESQESQDEYDKMFLDLKDEELLAALGSEAETSAIAELKSKEDALCKVLDKFITPAVYRLVCKYFGEREHIRNDATNVRAADEWIDCWVGCASVLVRNNYKDWDLYVKLGQQSWEKIIDDSWRRRVGLRFNLTLLRLDPGAYNKMKNEFIAVLLVALLSYGTTIEHEFMSVVLSLDGLQHPLLRAAPIDPSSETRTYEVTLVNYEVVRGQLIETVLRNTAGYFHTKADAESQACIELVVMMLSTMRDIYRELPGTNAQYGEFCRNVFDMLRSHPELVSHPRMSDLLAWERREWGV